MGAVKTAVAERGRRAVGVVVKSVVDDLERVGGTRVDGAGWEDTLAAMPWIS